MFLKGKITVITGAESGIGRAIALACAEAGASLALAGLARDGLEVTAKQALEAGAAAAVPIPTDIREEEAVTALYKQVLKEFGGLDAVVANAGVIGPKKPAIDITSQEWRDLFSVNLDGTFHTVVKAARILIEQKRGGSIIATGSSTAIRTVPGLTGYAASKAAIHGLMQALAVELGPHRIRVNTLVPGTTETPATRAMGSYLEEVARALPLQEVVQPEELGRLVAFALSDALPHMTGTLLKIDSGRTIG